jgi:hypothetical protein
MKDRVQTIPLTIHPSSQISNLSGDSPPELVEVEELDPA